MEMVNTRDWNILALLARNALNRMNKVVYEQPITSHPRQTETKNNVFNDNLKLLYKGSPWQEDGQLPATESSYKTWHILKYILFQGSTIKENCSFYYMNQFQGSHASSTKT